MKLSTPWRMMRFHLALAPAMWVLCAQVASAATTPPGREGKAPELASHQTVVAQDIESAAEGASAKETEVVTTHQISVGGRSLNYLATVGTLTLRDDSGKPTASVFYVAYSVDEHGSSTQRPVTFFFNGGPGAPSMGLHLASFAPIRIQTGENPVYIHPAPYAYGPNPHTLLDKTDMVFLDAIGTGYSRGLGDSAEKAFWSSDADVDAFGKAITRYLTKNSRWNSPKLLFGESYGTARAAMLAYRLQQSQVVLNGVILMSSALNLNLPHGGDLQSYVGVVPSYAAAALYHHRVKNPQTDLNGFLRSAEAFAAGPYAAFLEKGQRASEHERDDIANQMSGLTGLSVDFLKQANLRLGWGNFAKELLRDQHRTLGVFDARYAGIDTDSQSRTPSYDQLESSVSGALVAVLNEYLVRDLRYKTDMTYRTDPREINGAWDWSHKGPSADSSHEHWPYAALDLAAAMRINPDLKVLSLGGIYDLATPYFTTEYELDQMMLEPELQRNLQVRTYPSGHMAYVNPVALASMHEDIAHFIDGATASRQ
jgi:carboxypeptidase C (cathepsin A)